MSDYYESLNYNDLVGSLSNSSILDLIGYTPIKNLKTMAMTIDQLFDGLNVNSTQRVTINNSSAIIKTVSSDNNAFTFNLIEFTGQPYSIPYYHTTFNLDTNRINKTNEYDTIYFNTLVRYEINWSKLLQNVVFIATETYPSIIGDYLLYDTLTIGDTSYLITNYFINVNTLTGTNSKIAFTNAYNYYSSGIVINEDRFSYTDSQFIGTTPLDNISIVNADNNYTITNVENDINNIRSRNAVYSGEYIDDIPANTTYSDNLERSKASGIRTFYTFGNNWIRQTDLTESFYSIPYNDSSNEPNWYSTFKNWTNYEIGADREAPLRVIQCGNNLQDIQYNNFFDIYDQLFEGLTNIENNINVSSYSPTRSLRTLEYLADPYQYYITEGDPYYLTRQNVYFDLVPYNFMVTITDGNISSMKFNHDIVTANYFITNATNTTAPRIQMYYIEKEALIYNNTVDAYETLEPILNNTLNVNLIFGSTTLIISGLIAISLLFKTFKLLK